MNSGISRLQAWRGFKKFKAIIQEEKLIFHDLNF